MQLRQRRGFSLIDLMVASAVLMLLMAVLLPAVQGLRQAGYKQETIDNLKHMGLAIHNFNDTHARLPPVYDKYLLQFPASLHVYLLPYVEQETLYKAYMKQMGKGETAEAKVNVFIAGEDTSNTGDKVKGVQNFAANLRAFAPRLGRTPYDKDLPELAAVEPGSTRLGQSFPDGTSNTIVFATKYAACGEGGSRYAAEPNSKFAALFGQKPARKPAHASDETATYQLQPSAKECRHSPLMAQSFAKSLLVGLADGTVRTIAPEMSAETWNRALHPSDGNVLGKDW